MAVFASEARLNPCPRIRSRLSEASLVVCRFAARASIDHRVATPLAIAAAVFASHRWTCSGANRGIGRIDGRRLRTGRWHGSAVMRCYLHGYPDTVTTGGSAERAQSVIVSFADRATEDLFHNRPTVRARHFGPDIVAAVLLKMDMLNAMIPEDRTPTQPGLALQCECRKANGQHTGGVGSALSAPVRRVNELVRCKRGTTPETAWQLSQALGTTPELWVNLQSAYDLARSRPAAAMAPLVTLT
jgi:addiction module HigA family antidote